MKTVLTTEDLFKIHSLLEENGYGEIPLSIVNKILTKDRLKKINEHIRISNNDKSENNQDFDQINVQVGNIEFQYKLVKDEV